MKKILLLFAILSSFIVNAQKIGEWTTHTPGLKVISVDLMNDNVFAATPYDVYYYNTIDNSINRLSKVNGLSDIGISIIRYNASAEIMFVGYTNTNIDIIDNQGDVTNIPDIYNKYILGDKTINNVFFNGNLAYVCCGFGIVVIDLKRNEVKDTYIIGPNGSYLGVNDLTICNNIFYAATTNGVYYATADNPYLADFSQWKRITALNPETSNNFSQIETFDGYVVANSSDNEHNTDILYAIADTTSFDYFINGYQRILSELRVCDDKIILTEKAKQIKVYDTNRTMIFSSNENEPLSTLFDNKRNCYWTGSNTKSLVKVYTDNTYEYIPFNGPYSDKTFSINASGNNVWVAAGGYTSTWAPIWNHTGFSQYDGDSWTPFNRQNITAWDSITDITWVKGDPVNSNIFYAASYSKGLVVFEGNTIKNVYSQYNSSLGNHFQYFTTYTFVTGFDFDSNNNMWLANTGSEKMLSVWRRDGTWQAYSIGNSDIGRIMVDDNDIKWIYVRGGEITLFNAGTIKTVNKGANTGALPGDANCFVTDNKGTVWVGTTDGVGLFYDSRKIFNNSTYACSRILIPRNDGSGQADYLLSGQSVLAIAVDGANNLWFGTNNGVIHTSNDGQTTYHHFTMENSPLLSNKVNDIAIDDDGNVYFATDQGITSFKGTATKGNETNSDVIVYPNPVRPEHSGIVGIKGLVTDALVKITTTSGAFVTHLQAEGGQAVWDCTDINGSKVQPGIYLIFVSDETGKETYATKVLIMK
ncbi:MAG: hypothetical protein J6T53_05770 [Bacteroidales bacterium]|nr:hypothetical protein [Bacteroidales bacterium]